jgi:hypothetical protein
MIHSDVEGLLANHPTVTPLPSGQGALLTVHGLLWYRSVRSTQPSPVLEPVAPELWAKLKRPAAIAEVRASVVPHLTA